MSSVLLKDVKAQLAELQHLVSQAEQDGQNALTGAQCAEVSRSSHRLYTITRSPGATAYEIAMMPYINTFVRLAIDMGIVKCLSDNHPHPRTSQHLADFALSYAQSPSVSSDFVTRVMRLLTLYGLADEVDHCTYAANATTLGFAAPDKALESLVVHFSEFYNPVIQSSGKYFATHGYVFVPDGTVGPFQDYWKWTGSTYEFWSSQPPMVLERLNRFMKSVYSVPWYDWMDLRTMFRDRMEEAVKASGGKEPPLLLVDVGGGKALMLHNLRQRLDKEDVKGTLMLQERPPVVKDALAGAAEMGFSRDTGMPGVQYVSHDYLQPQPDQAHGSLYYYMSYVLHNCSDDKATQLLRQVARAMQPQYSRLLINERVLQLTGNDLYKAGSDIHIGYGHGAKERTLPQYAELVGTAGMRVVEHHKSPDDGQDMIECELKHAQ